MLSERRVLVTGGAQGIGAAIALGLAKAGADIVIADLAAQSGTAEALMTKITELGQRAEFVEIDVTDKASVEAAVEAAGQIDVLVNNAGILVPSRLEDLDEASWQKHFDINAKGVLLCTNAFLPQMRERKFGRVINIASLAARQGIPTEGHYAATKATVVTLTRVYAQEVGEDGITVNAICPGIILTEMAQNKLVGADREYWTNATSLKRLGDPGDVAGAAVYFASDLADYVTGQALNVCGGLYFH
ncbi:3-oxoacyl-[acyl-carrier protein] reductase [Candidatus Rhodobacter oscarellae]|uniref:3-oxoacyl-[acyl-carrier protein] reductase n=1 Tax=Candidatus Rhodobacter oscarellae TaxID=1675527 RepID=A0A0J9GZD3_9RHOB|nr:SDR family oxidoreductase [Candidatus Rhodobacter lobularis]KMW58838.1 3-oxoacyl-[acyl-carrier protein] reductase [Candidatus Rhodobacter lobularis]